MQTCYFRLMQSKNTSLFVQRFPRYLFAAQEWTPTSVKDAVVEPKDLPLGSAQILYLYGLSSRIALQLISWLEKNPVRRLIFLEPDTGVIASFLKEQGADEVLSQKQIEIYHLPKKREKRALLYELSSRYSFCAVFICYCRGNKQGFYRLKTDLLRKTAMAYTNHAETTRAPDLLSHFKNNCKALPSSFCVESLKDAFASIPAIICGAGPSLQKAIETLQGLKQRALIFAGGSAITALSLQGVEPHFAVAIDPNKEEFDRLKNSAAPQTPLLYSLRLNSSCLPLFNGPLGYTRSTFAGPLANWIEKEAGLSDPLIGQGFPPESFSVTMVAAAIAYHFGCNPILFEGIDLACTQNRRYADGIDPQEEKHLHPFDRPLNKQSKSKAKVTSAVRWVIEAGALSKLARSLKDRRWIQCTADGLPVKGLESMPLAEAATLFREERDLSALIQKAISSSPVAKTLAPLLEEKLKGLEESLDHLQLHLDALIRDVPGLSALAEVEMKEEMSYQLLFHHAEKALSSVFPELKDRKSLLIAFQALIQRCKEAIS